ncbi:sensor histidine kinase [Tessaracoccus caeni]|uniref:sensor histidine kinase n=1 Tax=Tessaracoccus caeni TaxID=3031239 RepID=UPI0023DB5174|nr:HAMP domain-containing sensor histidine kinase [Tessaracoccus caeni]MDF1488192.1 HAMP domain-containing sensor histidine kinase [Tessaracoccus caeni]
MNAWRSRWRGRLRKPGLRGRTALAMVVTVALACAVLTITTTLWAATNHRENQEQRLKDAISGDADRLRAALEINPNATTDTELWETGWDSTLGSDYGEGLLIPLDSQSDPPDPALAITTGVGSFEERIYQTHPECLHPEWWPGHQGADTTTWWIGSCGDYLTAYALTQPHVDDVPGKPWFLMRALYLPYEDYDDPAPELRRTLLLISAGVIAAAALLARWVARGVITPVTEAGAMARAVAAGDLSVRIPIRGYDDVAAMSRAINTMANRLTGKIEELERANETQRRFVSDVAHELRTPTTALLASAEALETPSTQAAVAALVAPQLRRLAGLTEDLLEVSRMDAGRATLVTNRIDVVDLITELLTEIPAEVTYSGPSELWLTTDPVRLQAILRNLVTNAIQHGKPPITITLTHREYAVSVDVHDDGPGVPDDLRDRVFDRFVRGDEARHGTSSGLGLAIARENAHLLGGALTLAADGTTFQLVLPADDPSVPPTPN